mgnify:CR=1 FL=1
MIVIFENKSIFQGDIADENMPESSVGFLDINPKTGKMLGKGTVTSTRFGGQNRYDAFSFHVLPQPIYGFRKVIDMVISTLESKTYHLFIT